LGPRVFLAARLSRRELAIKLPLLAALASLALVLGVGRACGADANLGRDVAANCANCHGTDGRSHGGIPGLAGRDPASIIQQMKDFRDGKRPATVMRQFATAYTDAEIAAAAAYFAAQKAH
jgi:cytochrome c553